MMVVNTTADGPVTVDGGLAVLFPTDLVDVASTTGTDATAAATAALTAGRAVCLTAASGSEYRCYPTTEGTHATYTSYLAGSEHVYSSVAAAVSALVGAAYGKG